MSPKAHGVFPSEYISNPSIDKPMDQIYADLNGFTWELLADDHDAHEHVDFNVVLPPLLYEGRFVKGLFYSRGVDFLDYSVPGWRSLFVAMAYTMFCSYPWAEHADAYLACYPNAAREAWYRRTFPNRAHSAFVPLADTDYLDEYRCSPCRQAARDIDVLCISRLQDVKNVQMIAHALKIYWSKYGRRLRAALVTGHRGGVSEASLPAYAREQLRAMRRILGRVEDFIELFGYVHHWNVLPRLLSSAKVFVLGSLIEGKNRSLAEAMSCNTPVVCFRQFNQYARAEYPVFPDGAGLFAEFDAESLADTLHAAFARLTSFSPRLYYLKDHGRRNFLNRCLDSIPYYRETLPGFTEGSHVDNPWLDAAIHRTHGVYLRSFLDRPGKAAGRAWGVNAIRDLLELYACRLDVV